MTDPLALDTDKLSHYLSQHIRGFTGPLTAEKFSGGQSNPTYLMTTPEKKYVLRRQPLGKLLPGAHAMDREHTILSALFPTPLPVAEPLHLCQDPSVIGSDFYVMEFKQGRILWDPTIPEVGKEERNAMYTEMNRVLAELHKVDIDTAGLQNYGKRGHYFARQTHTWTKQYKASEINHIAAMEALIEWLPVNMPPEDGLASITHGDFRLDNLMFDADTPEVIAVLDWELSTIGHPYADLAYQCMQYYMPRGKGLPGLAGADLAQLGIPTEQEYVDMYCQRMGFNGIDNWNFYLAFSLFRLAAICQGVVKRAQQGNASSDKAAQYGELVEPLAHIALGLTKDS